MKLPTRAAAFLILVFRTTSQVFLQLIVCGGFILSPALLLADTLAAPGDLQLRNDLQLLNDTGAINIPLTAWPVALGDVDNALRSIDSEKLGQSQQQALDRLRDRLSVELELDTIDYLFGAAAAQGPRVIRSFEDTPRADAEAYAQLSWVGERFVMKLAATYADNPADGDEIRPDGTYLGIALGNWMLTAGWQDRWFGPGRDGSLILSNNARPSPGLAIQRGLSTPFKTKWLSWIGPWTMTSFMTVLDDDRAVNDTWLFGLRGSFRPLAGLEIGISRTAQWCGDDRPCDLSTFADLLLGNDNKGVNVDPDDEPGNQLGGFDMRWSLPRNIPAAVYMQWIGEDGRGGGGKVGSWLRQAGVEHWGTIGDASYRMHFELSDTQCREGGFGFSDEKPNCAYEHHIYRTGYRYKGRALAHAADADSLSYSIGSTLVQPDGHTWSATLRHVEINRVGLPDARHTLSAVPRDLTDVLLTHSRVTALGRFYLGIGYNRQEDAVGGDSTSDFEAFVRWTSR
ncbi:MAG TPA: capsule assembly Wzi family protein [Woeseiaceae bacterium]|nr:capsule assembly Wzi family protein [Woeseiaceae bacterium]